MHHPAIKTLIVSLLLAGLLLTMGCSKVTVKNYNRLEMGMTYQKVTALLGKPDQCDGAMGAESCTWGNDQRYINVKFVGDKVVLFSAKGL